MNKTGVCTRCALKERPYVDPVGRTVDADVIVIGGFPLDIDVEKGGFSSKAGEMLQRLINQVRHQNFTKRDMPNVAYTYAVRCNPLFDEAKKKYDTNIDAVNCCSEHNMRMIDRVQPKAILALGTDAVKALGFKETIRAMRGGLYEFKTANGKAIPVVPSYHPAEVMKTPGLFPTWTTDVKKALKLGAGESYIANMDAKVFKEADKIVDVLDKVTDYAKRWYEMKNSKLSVSVDMESTSLEPADPNSRMIAISLAFRDNEGIAYPVEHRANPFSPDDLKRILSATERLLGSPYVSLVACNGKFDTQWIMYKYGLKIHHIEYDCQLAEHCLDEDKKGEYSLKDITRDRFPALGRYEQELKEKLSEKQAEFDKELRDAIEEWKKQVHEAIADWWVGLTYEERSKMLGEWVTAGYLNLSDSKPLLNVQTRNTKKGPVVMAKYKTAVVKMVSKVDISKIPGIVIPPIPKSEDSENKVTFEDIDIDILLWYAAMDALTTRMIAKQQVPEFNADTKRINETQNKEGASRKIVTKTLMHSFRTITMPMSSVLSHMEYHGVRFDRERCQRYIDTVEAKMDELKDELFTEVGYKFSLSSSSSDLSRILYDDMGLPIKKRTDTGAPSTDADTLKELSDEYDIPFIKSLLTHRKMEKVHKTYLKNWLKISEMDGKIRCNFNLIGTATYRLSSSNPERYSRLGLLQ